jgi:pimeloyl-ACP methyl ester carboxylesterase
MRALAVIGLLLAALALAYALGPRARKPRLDPVLPPAPPSPAAAEAWLQGHEAATPHPLKPDNQARIVWAAQPGQATDWSIVYLHGYSASWREGGPVHQNTAARYGANLLLTRLHGHGLQVDEPLLDFDADAYWADAKQALVLGAALGRKVLLMATSSGTPLALRLAAEHPGLVQGMVLYSPNMAIRNALAPLMAGPWGLQIARAVKGGLYNEFTPTEAEARYWYPRQRLEGAVQLQLILSHCCGPDVLARVHAPLFAGVFYKDEEHQDQTISVAAVRKALPQIATPAAQKRYVEFPQAGRHVIACDLSSGAWQAVQAETWAFLEEVLGMRALR